MTICVFYFLTIKINVNISSLEVESHDKYAYARENYFQNYKYM